MLTNTFLHVAGLSYGTERLLWRQGIIGWEELLKHRETVQLPHSIRGRTISVVSESVREMRRLNHRFFRDQLPRKETWRAYKEFKDHVVFLDIETTGLDQWDDLTVIGMYNGKEMKSFVRGKNLGDFQEELSKYKLIVTYNGSRFDIPFLKHKYRELTVHQIHLDLMYPLWRLGYKGGLKVIEQSTGISRSTETTGIDGWEAIRLWEEYMNGSQKSLDLLLKYNAEDVINLKTLADFVYEQLYRRTFAPFARQLRRQATQRNR
jgi:uncharacterized protein YprB with RNaseH-like and TPR domain